MDPPSLPGGHRGRGAVVGDASPRERERPSSTRPRARHHRARASHRARNRARRRLRPPPLSTIPLLLADVALPVPLSRPFTYAVPSGLASRVVPGARVTCPFSGRRLVGVVLTVREGEPPPKVKTIASVVGDEAAVPADLLAFLKDLSQYYLAPIGEVLKLALPPVEKEVARGLEEPTLFGGKAKGVGARKVQWVTAVTSTPEESRSLRRARAPLQS